MEILEIVSSRIDTDKNLLEVQFRTITDSEDEIREDKIDYSLVLEYGYVLEDETFDLFDDFYDEEDDDDIYLFGDMGEDLDEQEVISFLNEYYLIYNTRLPESEIY